MDQELSTYERRSLSLLKKGKKGLSQAIFSRTGLITILLIMNTGLLALLFWQFYEYLPHFYGTSAILSAVMVLTVINGRHDPSARVTWLIIVMCSPVFGSLLYFYIQSDMGHRKLRDRIRELIQATGELLPQDPEVTDAFERVDPAPRAWPGICTAPTTLPPAPIRRRSIFPREKQCLPGCFRN